MDTEKLTEKIMAVVMAGSIFTVSGVNEIRRGIKDILEAEQK
jgi:hypothetical protein